MFHRRSTPGLPRRVVASYLLFCIVSVCWLTLGGAWMSHHLLRDCSTDACLARLGKLAAAAEMAYLRQGLESMEKVLRERAAYGGAVACSVVSDAGIYLAHSDPQLVGEPALEIAATQLQWGAATGLRYVDSSDRTIHEYRTSLAAGRERIGELRMEILEPGLKETLAAAARIVPWVLCGPLAMIAVGGIVLARLTRGPADVEAQLRRIARTPLDENPPLESLRPSSALGVGWNRVVEAVTDLRRQASGGGWGNQVAAASAAHEGARFEEILQQLSDGVAVSNAEGRIEFANHAVAALLGESGDLSSLLGEKWAERLSAGACSVTDAELLTDAAPHANGVCEVSHADGDIQRVYRVARTPLDRGERGQSVWLVRDVTQHKLAERSRDQFIDTVTHELRTPLSNIKAYAETLASRDAIDVERQKQFCNIINAEVSRLARFVDDLLSISSMEVGTLTADLRHVDLARLFEEATAKVQPLMERKKIAFSVSLPPKMPSAKVDKDKIVAVLVNLLGNAAKYTPEEGRVELYASVEDNVLRIVAKDTGVGIAANELPHVFDKFFRSADPLVQAETGTGLGLSLAREVVRMHNGEIVAESELGVGSAFTVTLPLA